jgi:hypothetical protein
MRHHWPPGPAAEYISEAISLLHQYLLRAMTAGLRGSEGPRQIYQIDPATYEELFKARKACKDKGLRCKTDNWKGQHFAMKMLAALQQQDSSLTGCMYCTVYYWF